MGQNFLTIPIDEADSEPLVGMSLIEGYQPIVQVFEGSHVELNKVAKVQQPQCTLTVRSLSVNIQVFPRRVIENVRRIDRKIKSALGQLNDRFIIDDRSSRE